MHETIFKAEANLPLWRYICVPPWWQRALNGCWFLKAAFHHPSSAFLHKGSALHQSVLGCESWSSDAHQEYDRQQYWTLSLSDRGFLQVGNVPTGKWVSQKRRNTVFTYWECHLCPKHILQKKVLPNNFSLSVVEKKKVAMNKINKNPPKSTLLHVNSS